MKKVTEFVKKEIVLCAAALLAVASAFFVAPDARYIEYIDYRTLAILFCLMAVMAGFRRIGVFSSIAKVLLSGAGSLRTVMLILVMLCFFCSMLITNDVALITFVPLAITVLNMADSEAGKKLLTPVVVMQTIAANLGSMLTPVGNPQNLYLYSRAGLSFGSFILLMLPYNVLSLVLLIIWILIRSGRSSAEISGSFSGIYSSSDANASRAGKDTSFVSGAGNTGRLITYLLLFVLCIMTVIRVIPYWAVLAVVILSVFIADRSIFKNVDYCLLLTFAGFFIFIGNMGRIPAVHDFIQNIVTGQEIATSIISSQVISNVPAALLLSGFTDNYIDLIIGTNLGGLGTIIASMASLISFKFAAAQPGISKGKYLLYFTVSNVIFLALLIALRLIIS